MPQSNANRPLNAPLALVGLPKHLHTVPAKVLIMDPPRGFQDANGRPVYHAAIKKSVQRKLSESEDSMDPLARSSTTIRKNTPVRGASAGAPPKPKFSVALKSPSPASRTDYQEAKVIQDGAAIKSLGGHQAGGESAATVASDLPSQVKQTVTEKVTPVPLPESMQRPIAHAQAQSNFHISETSAAATASTTVSDLPQTPLTAKRGRPKGWKPGMSYAAIRGTTSSGATPGKQFKPSSSVGGAMKRRGRPPKQPSPPPRELYHSQSAPFLAFLCEWSGCKAELHNLETLRRHVRIVHLRHQGAARWSCCWGECAKMNEGGRKEFSSDKELENHLEERHLVPFEWHIGDGPRNSMSAVGSGKRKTGPDEDEGIPDYLKDASGNQITPSIRGQAVEDYATWRTNRMKLKQLLLDRDRNLPSGDEESPVEEEALPIA